MVVSWQSVLGILKIHPYPQNLKNNNTILYQRINLACKRLYIECLSKLPPNKVTLSERFLHQYSISGKHAELLTGDIQFITARLCAKSMNEKKRILEQYLQIWIISMDGEFVLHRKQSVGRRMANQRLFLAY